MRLPVILSSASTHVLLEAARSKIPCPGLQIPPFPVHDYASGHQFPLSARIQPLFEGDHGMIAADTEGSATLARRLRAASSLLSIYS